MAVLCPPCFAARGAKPVYGVESLATLLEDATAFEGAVRYEVSLPMSDEDVVYSVKLASRKNVADTLCGFDYLIDWELLGREAEGFLAYFSGHHYRYRDNRLQEYHFDWDSIPFMAAEGVQRTGQFVDLLPFSVARELRAMENDESFDVCFCPDTVVDGRRVAVVSAIQTIRGYVGRNFSLVADPQTGQLLKMSNEYNPGQISEQSVTVTYSYDREGTVHAPVSEEDLIAVYPEAFEKFRECNYRIENLRGLQLPAFSLPTLTGERYTYHRGDGFLVPMVIAFLDPDVETTRETIVELRKAVSSMPCQVELTMAFNGSNVGLVGELAGNAAMGEIILTSANSFARDCGTSVFPTVLVVGVDGQVADVVLGFNKNLSRNVIQSLALLR